MKGEGTVQLPSSSKIYTWVARTLTIRQSLGMPKNMDRGKHRISGDTVLVKPSRTAKLCIINKILQNF